MMRPAVLDDESSYYHTFLKGRREESSPVESKWSGKTAQWLGLHGEVTPEQFDRLRQGSDPQNGGKLLTNAEQNRERGFYDLVLAAPPSVTLQYMVGRDERLLSAHRTAVGESLQFLENRAEAREEVRGLLARRTGNLLIAQFEQTVNERGNPELHTHCATANMTWDSSNGQWRPVDAEKLYEARNATTEVYQNALARELTKAGYAFESARDANGIDKGLELVCVPEQLRQVVEKGQHTERQLRENPDAVLPGITKRLENAKDHALEIAGRSLPLSPETASEAVSHAVQETFARVSVAKELDLFSAALRAGRGHVSVQDVQKEIDVMKSAKALLAAGGELATKESAQREKSMQSLVNNGVANCPPHAASPYKVPGLSQSQQEGVDWVLTSKDWAISLTGPDSERPRLLAEISRGIAQNHKATVALSPTGAGAEELKKAGLEKVTTVESLLNDRTVQSAMRGHVFLVDDAARIGSKDIHEVMKLCRQGDSRIVFARDAAHDNSPGASDALSVLENESRMACKMISPAAPHLSARYAKAVSLEQEEHGRGFDSLERMEVFKEVSHRDRPQLVAEAYIQTEGSKLVIAQDATEADRLSRAIHEREAELGRPQQPLPIELASNALEGKSVDHVLISTDEIKHDQLFDAVSKAHQTCQVFTSDVEALRQAVLETGRQHTAMELAAKAQVNTVAKAHTQEAGRAYDNAGRASVAAAQSAQQSPGPEVGR